MKVSINNSRRRGTSIFLVNGGRRDVCMFNGGWCGEEGFEGKIRNHALIEVSTNV